MFWRHPPALLFHPTDGESPCDYSPVACTKFPMLFLLPAGASSDEQIPSEKRAHCKDVRAGPRSDMCRHEAGKELRVFRKDSCYALSQRGARIEFEQRLPIQYGRRMSRRCAVSYRPRSLAASASARAAACLNARPNPSPVIASTQPDASPINATRPRQTRDSLSIEVTPPRCALVGSPCPSRAASPGSARRALSSRSRGFLEITAAQTSIEPTGVMYACNPWPQ